MFVIRELDHVLTVICFISSAPGAEMASGGGHDDVDTDEESRPQLCKF